MALHTPRPPLSCFEQGHITLQHYILLQHIFIFSYFSCFIGDIRVFFGAFLGPILAILLFNVIVFVIVIAVLIKHSRKKLGREVEKGKTQTIIRLMLSITGVMSIFGTGLGLWGSYSC